MKVGLFLILCSLLFLVTDNVDASEKNNSSEAYVQITNRFFPPKDYLPDDKLEKKEITERLPKTGWFTDDKVQWLGICLIVDFILLIVLQIQEKERGLRNEKEKYC
ncbi:hypothetical protein [Enterococcus faecalis]|uniref:hypothetical protein n=1 Tax=Enterococcus faecalis TaxID=1351 RepID=UPI001E40AB5F|nr:hypothetical protein [Enterococcus faecalis]MDI7831930.1 hypothetical protein [Enterococcus faecalis]